MCEKGCKYCWSLGNDECSLEWLRWWHGGDRTWSGLWGVSRKSGGAPEQRRRGCGFSGASWCRQDTTLMEHEVCVGIPWKNGPSEEMDVYAAVPGKAGRAHRSPSQASGWPGGRLLPHWWWGLGPGSQRGAWALLEPAGKCMRLWWGSEPLLAWSWLDPMGIKSMTWASLAQVPLIGANQHGCWP